MGLICMPASQGISLDVFLAIFPILPRDTNMPFTFVRSFDAGGADRARPNLGFCISSVEDKKDLIRSAV